MNQHLQKILNYISQLTHLNDDEKTALLKSVKDADKDFEITSFKLDRTEKVKRTTAILLEETIAELEQKRKAAEAQNRELEIETSLERVRTIALSMNKPDDMPGVCKAIAQQLELLNVKEIRNVQTAIFYPERGSYINYEYYAKHNKTFITETSFTNHKMHRAFAEQMLKGKGEFFSTYMSKAELPAWIAYQKTTNVFIDTYIETASSLNYYWYSLGPVALGISTYDSLKEEDEVLFKRFLKVFELAYRRYLDIEKAEAQAREAQIQLALERVRARTMAMQKSDELADTASILFQQIKDLGFETWSCGFCTWQKNNFVEVWMGADSGGLLPPMLIPYKEEPTHHKIYEASFKNQTSHHYIWEGKALEAHYAFLKTIPSVNEAIIILEKSGLSLPERQCYYVGFFEQGYLLLITKDPNDELKDLSKRFASVFEQTYTRFLDLKKSEAQVKESQTQLALERVRAQSMMMQHSTELDDTLRVFHEQVLLLGIPSAFSFLWLPDEEKDRHIFWAAWAQNNTFKSKAIDYPLDRNEPATKQCLIDWKGNEPVVAYHVPPDGVASYFAAWSELIAGVEELKPGNFSDGLYYVEAFMKYGCFGVIVKNTLPEDERKILHRFAVEFERTYRRFLDLQKAEAQAKEAQVEAALERVRSRSMGMQKSEELTEVIKIVYLQLTNLNIHLDHAGFVVDYTPGSDWHFWIADEQDIPSKITHPYFDSVWANQFNEAKLKGFESFATHLNFEEKNKFYHELLTYIPGLPDASKDFYLSCPGLAASTVLFDNVSLYIENFEGIPYTDKDTKTFKRFGKVFQQTYTRFLDLQKAEAQSRESQIELSLERVRAKTMAMHNSADVGETAAVMVEELKKLGIETIRCGIGIMHEPGDMEVWTISTDENNKTDIIIGWLDMNMHPLLHGAFESWRNKIEAYYYDLKDDDLLNYYNAINNYPGYPIRYDTAKLPRQIHHNESHFAEGTLFAFSLQQLTEDQRKIFKRFAGVFGQTYRRYLDLKKAEAQAKEAQIEAALERVRSRTLAMQKSDELAETSAVLFKQLISLGIEPHRLYISIMKNEEGQTEFWITDEEGSKISMAYENNLNNNPSFKKMFNGWKRQEKSLVIDMQGKELKDYFKHLTSLGIPFKDGLTQKRRIQYLAFFNRGFIGMAAPDEQPEETLHLLERFAAVFNLTFTRFNDLKIAEAHALQAEQDLIEIKAARKKAEETLAELQSTQKQLVQSEKMASLGELTAGIAHEIQNPLNFVNNFSEVSKELLDEMKAALESGDKEEVNEIVDDVIQNLEKINHHGKRADAIVKGMLQHSRQTSGTKEPTDINALCDEYLRLSYHGLRAKDKSFNSNINTDFDVTIEKINIIPQDIGRVLLNILTNAFYAVSKKLKDREDVKNFQGLDNYKPLVSVQTKRINDKVEIKVTDNGSGIPQSIIDKIFQPFFTTKPTGQGTGLGLSLAYDIINKEHNGTIKVESKEDEGSKFLIQIPLI